MWMKPETILSVKDQPAGNAYYLIPGHGACYNSYPVKGADIDSFMWCLDFAKDKNRCYIAGSVLKGADPGSFEVLNMYFARDKNQIYTAGGMQQKLDRETFEVLDEGFETDLHNRKRKITSYAKDRQGLWMMEYYSLKPTSVKGIDTSSFKRINDGFAKDSRFVLWRGKKVKNADPATFIAFNINYGRDKNHIICQDHILAVADYETFEAVATPITLAKDKNRYYWFSDEIPEAGFTELKGQN